MLFFFFQAEDGIRDLVRSRGLGDVYKRQVDAWAVVIGHEVEPLAMQARVRPAQFDHFATLGPVSYTHLTLPTSDLV